MARTRARDRRTAVLLPLALLVAGLLSTPADAAAAFCSVTGLDTYRWDGEAGNGLWADPVNWDHAGNANTDVPGTTTDVPYDDAACLPAGAVVQLDTGGQGVSADLAALDVGAGASLSVGRGGALLLHGGPAGTGSVARARSVVTLDSSTLGGEATFTVQGTMAWTSGPGGAATWTTRRCDVADPPTCAGPAPSPGRTVIAPTGRLVVGGRGVNLEDRRVLDNRGTTVLTGEGYIAADFGTRVLSSGTFVIDNGLGVFEGRRHYGLATRNAFVNSGVLRKQAPGTSVVGAQWSMPPGGSVVVTAGQLSLDSAANGSTAVSVATVRQGASFGTGACAAGGVCTAPSPTTADRQTTSVTLPALGTGSVAVALQELPGERTPAMRIAPVRIETPGAAADAAHPMTYALALDSSLRRAGETPQGLAATLPVSRRADGTASYVRVPSCAAGGLSAAVPSCVDRAASGQRTAALGNGDVVLVVRSLQNSRWVV